MTAELTAVTVAGTSVTVDDAMTASLAAGTAMPAVVVLTADSGTITAGGKTVKSGVPFKMNFNNSPVLNISVKDGDTVNEYTLAATVAKNDILEMKMDCIRNVGWFAARYFEGDLDAYKAGGIILPMGKFKAKYTISVQITGGYVGYFDVAQNKLMVYKSAGTEATASDLATEHYQIILMA